jgi:hypothetical protein
MRAPEPFLLPERVHPAWEWSRLVRTMSKQDNDRYLRSQTVRAVLGNRSPGAAVALMVGGWLVLLGLFFAFRSLFGTPPEEAPFTLTVPLPLGTLVGAVGFALAAVWAVAAWKRRQVTRDYLRGLQQAEPGALIALVDRVMPARSPLPDVDALRAQARALAYALYGDVVSARRELGRVHWPERAPLVRALERGVEALLCLLCTGEPARGLVLAREAQELSELSAHLPGARGGQDFYKVYVWVGEVLTGQRGPDTLAALESEWKRSPHPVHQLVCAWALRVACQRAGDKAKAEEWGRQLQALAPHCEPLQRLPG